ALLFEALAGGRQIVEELQHHGEMPEGVGLAAAVADLALPDQDLLQLGPGFGGVAHGVIEYRDIAEGDRLGAAVGHFRRLLITLQIVAAGYVGLAGIVEDVCDVDLGNGFLGGAADLSGQGEDLLEELAGPGEIGAAAADGGEALEREDHGAAVADLARIAEAFEEQRLGVAIAFGAEIVG